MRGEAGQRKLVAPRSSAGALRPPRSGGWEVVPTRDPGGWWSDADAVRGAGRKARARPRAVSLREKGCEAVCPALFMEQARTILGAAKHKLCLSASGWTRTRLLSRVGPGKGRE